MPLQKRLYSLGVHKCEWEETFGGLFDRTMAMSRSTVVKTEISPLDLGAHHIVDLDTPTHVCQQFGCYNVRYPMAFRCGQKYIKPKRCIKTNCGFVSPDIGYQMTATKKKDVSNVTKYGMRDTKGWSKKTRYQNFNRFRTKS